MSSAAHTNSDALLISATCAVRRDGVVAGAGWLLDAEGHVVTAGHVTDTKYTTLAVDFGDKTDHVPAELVVAHYNMAAGVDFAILKLMGPVPAGRQPLPVRRPEFPNGKFRVCGYGTTLITRSFGSAEYVGPYDPDSTATTRMFRFDSKELGEEGYSGGAFYNDEWGAVVAIQSSAATKKFGAGRDTVIAMPIYRIAELVGDKVPSLRLHPDPTDAGYWYHVYLSYVRGGVEENWVEEFLLPELRQRLRVALGLREPADLYFDEDISRNQWDAHAVERVRRSCCLVPVLTGGYWLDPTCVAEFESFERRQRGAGGLTLGVLFHGERQRHATRVPEILEFTDVTYTHKGFPGSDKYGPFVDLVKALADRIAAVISKAPPDSDRSWPVATPGPVPRPESPRINRPRLS